MIIAKLITYLSVIIWIFPPLRQFRGRFFYYFLILGLSDPVTMALGYFNLEWSIPLFILFSAGLFLSLPQQNRYLRLLYLIPAFILYIAAISFLRASDLIILIGIIHLMIVFVLFKYTVSYVYKNGMIQVFHLLLLTYETSMMLKFINVIFEWNSGIVYFNFITGFQIILGILFCFIREDNPRLALKFR
ncbi:MAG: hypothetical protein ACM3UR_09010 [Bacteroidota bacterium]|jgi:hypothetical protein|nr:hypothetical protein [Ignavibacteria bacterium]MCU7499196.1 hypothetical protein [Ignavibacteria bacterium]MCU7513601.1 hypothetical protein [Ignavibacteria bacterium]MCU7520127.1 hypothetical protein [Ignavibacteria bacterium]MCU7525719.1 hypothetical protein [Ignavibacteria bacterium]